MSDKADPGKMPEEFVAARERLCSPVRGEDSVSWNGIYGDLWLAATAHSAAEIARLKAENERLRADRDFQHGKLREVYEALNPSDNAPSDEWSVDDPINDAKELRDGLDIAKAENERLKVENKRLATKALSADDELEKATVPFLRGGCVVELLVWIDNWITVENMDSETAKKLDESLRAVQSVIETAEWYHDE